MSGENPKTVIVTGAASGIGFACVQGLLAAGDRVCGADLQSVPAERLSADAGRFLEVRANVADDADCRDVVARTVEAFGRPHGMIHMAAAHSTLTWRELMPEHFDQILSRQRDRLVPHGARRCRAHGGGRCHRVDQLRLDQCRRRRRPRPRRPRLRVVEGRDHRPNACARPLAGLARYSRQRRQPGIDRHRHDRDYDEEHGARSPSARSSAASATRRTSPRSRNSSFPTPPAT